jgi:hypothetical protein
MLGGTVARSASPRGTGSELVRLAGGEYVLAIMPRYPFLVGAGAAMAFIVLANGAVAAAILDVDTTGALGDPLIVRASGGLTPKLFYRATFTQSAKDRRPRRQCARNIDRSYRVGTSTARVYVFRGRVPRTLACTQGDAAC